jgi:hypothetical protein
MKVNLARKNILMSAILTAGIVVSGSASAGLVNQDFSSGFNNWEGDITSSDTPEYPFNGVFGDFTDNFQTTGNSVTLTTSEEDDFTDYYEVILFQLFNVENLTAGNTALSISLDFSTIFTAPDPQDTSGYDPEAWAFLVDSNTDLVLANLTGGGTFDITSLAGQSDVFIEFGLTDWGDIGNPSSVSVSNIMFTQSGAGSTPTSVPEPSTLLLFTGALFAVIRKSKLFAK